MMRVELHRPFDQRAAAVPITGEGDQENGLVTAIERVERYRPLGGMQTAGNVLAKKQHNTQGLKREVIGRRKIHGTSCGYKGAIEGAWPGVEIVAVLM